MVCVIPESRPCGYYALWMIQLLTAAKASLSRVYVFCSVLLNTHKGVGTNYEVKFEIWTDADHRFGQGLAVFFCQSKIELSREQLPWTDVLCRWTQLLVFSCTEFYLYIFWHIFLVEHGARLTIGVNSWCLLSVILFGTYFTEVFVIFHDNLYGWLRPIKYICW